MSERLNKGFDIPLAQIEEVIGARINNDIGDAYNRVIPLREIKQVNDIVLFNNDVLMRLIRKIPLRKEGESIYPYSDSEIEVFRRAPEGFRIGQTFVHSKKLLSLMQDLESRLLSNFSTGGLSKMTPSKIYGLDYYGKKAISFYIPPIAEIYGDKVSGVVIIDGIHRSYICKSAGTTIYAIHINNVSIPLPFYPIKWEDAQLVDEKPPIEKRYVGLKRDNFRDLNSIGIDG